MGLHIDLETTSLPEFLFFDYTVIVHFTEKSIKSSVQLAQGERDWESLAQLSSTLSTLVIKLCIAAEQKTHNVFGWQVVPDLHSKNSTINKKLFGKIETVGAYDPKYSWVCPTKQL